MNIIRLLVSNSWLTLILAIFMGAASGGCSTLLLAQINNGINSNNLLSNYLLISFISLVLVTVITNILAYYLLVRLSQSAVYKLRLSLSQKILASPLRNLEQLGASKLLATLTKDINSISNAVLVLPFLCINLALVIGCLIYLAWLSWSVFLITITILIIGLLIVQLLLSKAYRLFEQARQIEDKLFKNFTAITEGTKELKLNRYRRDAFLASELEVNAAESQQANINSMTIIAIADGNAQLLFFLLYGLLIFALPQFQQIETNILSGYIVTLTYLMRPLESIFEILPSISQASVALKKIDTLGLSLVDKAENLAITSNYNLAFTHSLELKNITHTYYREKEENNFTIGAIDLTLYPQEIVFIIGGNGSGKSTLGKLIAGLYIPEAGEILVNGKLITEANRESYRQLFAAVFADFYLFENRLGIAQDDLDLKTKNYLQKLQLDKKVTINNNKFSTLELSQGQRKRLALLTAYLEDRPIYLFDEWAAEQDPYFREIFYQQLLPELKQRGKTVIVITHDDRYFDLADRLIKLDYGQIVENY
ncbi:ABC transporter ATP-binding protein [Pleurocapsa sp. CCALA 161]|uniref:cyclic peptide export ABC transporter n=1 Tax=Pleurocapsa sp. CCALA 161 TaxID=2107688 RepID=UPI000D04A640|nr:cyclic peptide export ABC transporter [Pleurocapsa sp. CCALA 161]PSB09024.1 ABC transporter ATP-binding protein [Pleurocapsa sp. CCALA 161]